MTEEKQKFYKQNLLKKWWFWVIAAIVFYSIGSSQIKQESANQPTNIQNQQAQTQQPKREETATPEIKLENLIQQTVTSYKSGMSYMTIEKSEKNKELIVSIQVKSFLTKNTLVHITGELSSKIFQTSFQFDPSFNNVTVWYYMEATDKYGNKSNEVGLSYSINKQTFSKINWQNFNAKELCDFLSNETTDNFENVCMFKLNIK